MKGRYDMSQISDSKLEINKSNLSFTGAKLDWMTAAAYDRRLKPSDFRIAFIIAQFINKETGKGFPSREEIADKAATSVPTVKRTIKLLQDIGWLIIRRKRTYDPKTKTWKTRNFYWLRHENVQKQFDLMTASKLKRRHGKGITGDPRKGITNDPLTPSYKHLQKGGKDSANRELITHQHETQRDSDNGKYEGHDTGRSQGGISTAVGDASSQQAATASGDRGMGGADGRRSSSAQQQQSRLGRLHESRLAQRWGTRDRTFGPADGAPKLAKEWSTPWVDLHDTRALMAWRRAAANLKTS